MDRVTVDVKLVNSRDLARYSGGRIRGEQVRRLLLRAVVDPPANWLMLPTAVAEELGLANLCDATSRSLSWHPDGLEMMEDVELELLGRTGTYRACVDPNSSVVVLGQIVLGDLDLLIDQANGGVYPRDPD